MNEAQVGEVRGKLERTLEQWALVKPEELRGGSNAQAVNVLTMALHDIAVLAEAVARTERNRDMWKGQCDRQAQHIRELGGQP
jgi:hypothetical protein